MAVPVAPKRYHELSFDPDFLQARRDGGDEIRFSRCERAALCTLAGRPGRLFSREQLHSAMNGEGGEFNDRSVDFIINRLRKKLRDPARTPRFIATQYGEGYVWIAKPTVVEQGGFVVVGPVRGLREAPQRAPLQAAIGRLTNQIAMRCAAGQRIAFLPQWSRQDAAAPPFLFSVGVDLISNEGGVQAAFIVRDAQHQRLVRVIRSELAVDDLDRVLGTVATAVVGAIWRELALCPAAGADPAGPPLAIRMQEAAITLSTSVRGGWNYIASRLADELAAAPNDPELAIMQATWLYARMLFEIDFDSDPQSFHEAEEEIERLVLGALPQIREDVVLRLGAAKLLFDLGEKHLPLAEDLVAETLAGSTCFAAALAQLGTIQAYRGDLGAALASFDQALSLCERNSEFGIFLLVKKSMVRVAGGQWAEARELLREIMEIKPAARGTMELFYASPTDCILDPEAEAMLAKLSPRSAKRLLSHHFQLFGRYFSRPDHARNLMAGPAAHIAARFGRAALPQPVSSLQPDLVN